MGRSAAVLAVLLTLLGHTAKAGGTDASPPNAPATPQQSVTLTISPDGTAVWDGEPLAGVPDLKNKLQRQTQQDPRLQLDLRFHTVGQLSDSNRQTLLDVLELAARFGYVHVQATTDGARLTVLGPNAMDTPPQ